MKKTIPSWATLSASQLARAQKQTPMASSPRPKMDAILTEAIKASFYFKQFISDFFCFAVGYLRVESFCPDIRYFALLLENLDGKPLCSGCFSNDVKGAGFIYNSLLSSFIIAFRTESLNSFYKYLRTTFFVK